MPENPERPWAVQRPPYPTKPFVVSHIGPGRMKSKINVPTQMSSDKEALQNGKKKKPPGYLILLSL